MYNKSQAFGMFQGDVVIRTAIVAGINDLRANPWALDYVFSSLAQDALTNNTYGQKEIDKAKNWFLNNEIPVVPSLRVDNLRLPCISISMQGSTEMDNTLGDKNYTVEEIYDEFLPVLYGPFRAGYDNETGKMVIPLEVVDTVIPNEGMVVEDSKGCQYKVLEAQGNVVYLDINQSIDCTKGLLLKSRFPKRVQLESANFREDYVIGCHSRGEPYECLYLHSILAFCLLRYRQKYLEARGFERSSINSTDIRLNDSFDAEIVFSRFVTLSGFVRQYWPKDIVTAIESTVVKADGTPNAIALEEQGWGWGSGAVEIIP